MTTETGGAMPEPLPMGDEETPETLSPEWTLGFTPHHPGTMANLVKSDSSRVLYTAGHTGVTYPSEKLSGLDYFLEAIIKDLKTNQLNFLRGHANEITSLCTSKDRSVAVTGESGTESAIVFWDLDECTSVKTILDPFPNGVIDIDMSPSGKYVAALSMKADGQALAIWNKEKKSDSPVIRIEFTKEYEFQHCVRFNETNERELLTNGKDTITFWTWRKNALDPHVPKNNASSVKKKVGNITQSVFLPNTMEAVSATTGGNLILWGIPLENSETDGREPIKAIKISNGKGITSVLINGEYIVVGGEEGCVKFIDFSLKLTAWFEDIKEGPIHTVSFAVSTSKSRGKGSQFTCPDFFVSTKKGKIVEMNAAMFKDVLAEKRKGKLIVDGFESRVSCVECHSTNPDYFVTGTAGGVLKLWHIRSKSQIISLDLKGNITSMTFHPDGKSLVVGVGNGRLQFLNLVVEGGAMTLKIGKEIKYITHSVTSISFSPCGDYFATADLGRYVGLFRWYHIDERPTKPFDWIYVGRYRAHFKAIVSISFLPANWGKNEKEKIGTLNGSCVSKVPPRLLSIGEDRMLREFDILASCIAKGLVLKNSVATEDLAIPTSFLPIGGGISGVACANDNFQIKVWSESALMRFSPSLEGEDPKAYRCTKTIASPSYGGPLNKMVVLRRVTGDKFYNSDYLFYTTFQKVIGLIKLPFDGNPNKSSALLAHSGEITSSAVTCDGRCVITTGGDDKIATVWAVSASALDASWIIGGDPDKAYLTMVDDIDPDGRLQQEIKDYFYLCQLKNQGLYTTDAREITNTIPPKQVINLFRALGFYPTLSEIRNLRDEIRATSEIPKLEDGTPQVDFPNLVRLFVNHRPIYGLSRKHVNESLRKIASSEDEKAITRNFLVDMLKTKGDKLTTEELTECLRRLKGKVDIREENPSISLELEYHKARLPERMDADNIARLFLGLHQVA